MLQKDLQPEKFTEVDRRNGRDSKRNRENFRRFRKFGLIWYRGFSLVIMFLLHAGCSGIEDRTVPPELTGVWVSNAEKQKGSLMAMKDQKIIFINENMNFESSNRIMKIKKKEESEGILYEITYENEEDKGVKISFYYSETPGGGIIRFKNRKHIEWKKKTGAVGKN